MTAIRSLSLLAAILAAMALWTKPDRRLWPVLAAFGVWFAGAALSLLSTRDLDGSLEAIENEVLRSLVVFVAFYLLTRRFSDRVWILATAGGFSVLSAMAVQSFFAHGEWRSYYVPPLQDYATSAITVLPLVLGYLAFRRTGWPSTLLLVVAVGLTLSAGFLTMSRAVWLVFAGGLTLAVGLLAIRGYRVRKRSVVLISLICVGAVGFAALVAVQRDKDLLYLEDRSVIYSNAVAKIRGNPITGSGYGHETDKAWYAKAMPGYAVFHPHNIVLSYLDQMGFLGILVLGAIFGAPSWVFWRAFRDSSGDAAMAALCGLVLVACVFVKNNLDFFFWKQNLWLFFAHLGIYLGQIEHSLANPKGTQTRGGATLPPPRRR